VRANSLINLVILVAAIWCFYNLYAFGHEAISITGKAMTQALGVTR
jgi:hypothetical protein